MHVVPIGFFVAWLVVSSCVLIRLFLFLGSFKTFFRRDSLTSSTSVSILLGFLLLPHFPVEDLLFSLLSLFYLWFLVAQHIWIYLFWCWSSCPALLGSMSHVARPLCHLSFYPGFSKSGPASWLLCGFYLIFNKFPATWQFVQCRKWAFCLCHFPCCATKHENAVNCQCLCVAYYVELGLFIFLADLEFRCSSLAGRLRPSSFSKT